MKHRIKIILLLVVAAMPGGGTGCAATPGSAGRGSLVLADSLPSDHYIHLNGGLDNFFFRLKGSDTVRVAFLGGSITAGGGWRDKVMQYLESAYPEVRWKFLNAGIPSLGSVPHAFRLETDVLRPGAPDLLFVEAAVNDLANSTPVINQRRALEGIVRHALLENPAMNIVLMAFADEDKVRDYEAGRTPQEVAVHAEISGHYKLPFINLAEEVTRRIQANEFTWKDDFIDLHPSPFGHGLYFRTIRRMFEMAAASKPRKIREAKLPAPLETNHYSGGFYASVSEAGTLKGFVIDENWKPHDGAQTRNGFVEVPVLLSETPGSTFSFEFSGTAAGIAVVAGPDAGVISYVVDDGPPKTVDLFTQWSGSLHLPWYLVLADGLKAGHHTLRLTLMETQNKNASGSACRIIYFLVNR